MRLILALLSLLILATAGRAGVVPPVLVRKEIARWAEAPAGVVSVVDAGTSTTFTLFVPDRMTKAADGSTTLTMHFHGAAWFVAQEHARRGARHPLLVANAREGDAAYENDVMREGVFRKVLAVVEERAKARVARLEVSSFSGGYSGARGLLRLPAVEPMIATLMMNDSLYISDATDSMPEDRRPDLAKLQPFVDFAKKAVAGERTFLMEHSSTPSLRSVGPKDCSRAIMAALGIAPRDVAPGSIPAARASTDFPLIQRADVGGAHFWCYRGENIAIHLAHVRNQADHWRALAGQTPLQVEPPAMPKRAIRPPEASFGGESVEFDLGTSYTLYIPANYKVPKDGAVELTIHFHGAVWFAIQEHLRRGLDAPLVALYAGEGSTVYKRQFEDAARFGQLLRKVEAMLKERGGPAETRVATVDVTSFSAGYGAVREIVKVPENVAVLRRVIMADSLYGSLDEAELAKGNRVVVPEHVAPWADFARHAVKGGKTLVLTYSDIHTPSYASTREVSTAVVAALGLKSAPVERGSIPGATDPDYPLMLRADAGSFHAWGYEGKDAVVHMTLARHIAEVWEALDRGGEP